MLSAFFDETHSPRYSSITAVAGFLFEAERLAALHSRWGSDPLIQRMPWPHAARCYGRTKEFELFMDVECKALMQRVAELARDVRGPGFVCEIEDSEFRDWQASYRSGEPPLNTPYSACVLGVMGMVRAHLDKDGSANEHVYYWFESGDPAQQDCKHMLSRIHRNESTKNHYRMHDYGFAPKESNPGFACADALAWEWQRNRAEALEQEELGLPDSGYRKVFKSFFKDESSPPINFIQATPSHLKLAGMTAVRYRLNSN